MNGHKEAQINAPTRKYIWNAIFFLYASWKFIHSISNISLSNMQSKTCKQIFHFPFQLYRSCCSLGEYWTELKCGVWLNRANRNQIKEMRGKNLLTNREKKNTRRNAVCFYAKLCVSFCRFRYLFKLFLQLLCKSFKFSFGWQICMQESHFRMTSNAPPY